jgi:hypothetical protein
VDPSSASGWVTIERTIRARPQHRARHDTRFAAFNDLYRASRDVVHRLGSA